VLGVADAGAMSRTVAMAELIIARRFITVPKLVSLALVAQRGEPVRSLDGRALVGGAPEIGEV
jgi:hypothetical protein